MDQWQNDFLNLENELLNTRKKLNDLIYERNDVQNIQDKALYEDKLHYLEVELQYINNQLQLLKNTQNVNVTVNVPVQNISVQANMPVQNISVQANVQAQNMSAAYANHTAASPYPTASYGNVRPSAAPVRPTAASVRPQRKPQDLEKIFGKNLMGIFASILIFISLVIFATLILPHLTDTLKMLAMYIASVAVLSAGLLLHRKNKENLFYIAIIGCGAGSLYLSLLLSNLYFQVIGDLALYGLILLWAVFVRYLTKIKSLVFNIIGQAGILIASILGTIMCVTESDPQKFFVLSIFYFISAVVFSNMGKTYLRTLFGRVTSESNGENKVLFYEDNLCSHICKTLNVLVYTVGFDRLNAGSFFSWSDPVSSFLITFNALLFMGYLLFEFFFSYMEECRHGAAFQILSMINATLLVFLFEETTLFADDVSLFIDTSNWTFVFMYLVSIAALIYVEMKKTDYKLFSQIWCFFLIFIACRYNAFMMWHLYPYITIVPFMLCGKWRKDNVYLGAGIAYLAGFPLYIWDSYSTNGIEGLFMLAVLYGAFLYVSRTTDQTWFKIAGYIIISITAARLVYDISWDFWKIITEVRITSQRSLEASELRAILGETSDTYSMLTTFCVLAIIHLILSRLEYFGKDKVTGKIKPGPIEGIMLGINALLMIAGCVMMYNTDVMLWKLPIILITILLFMINSKELLSKHKYAGYYVALKYTALMLCIINSYDAVDYVTSICLLVFAVISIVTGFYKDMIAFRLYGLILSMLSVVKLIMFDIKYDSTIESAVSFFVSGVLCFVISFIYNRIDGKLRGK